MGRIARLSRTRLARLAWCSLAILSLLLSAAHPALIAAPALAQDGTPASTDPQGEIATQEPVEVAPATATVAFRVVDLDDQPVVDGYRLCIDGVACVDILDGRATVDGLAAGTHTYEISWKWDGEGPFQHKIDTFWVDPSIGENQVRIELTATPVFAPAVEPSSTDEPPTVSPPTATDIPSPTSTDEAAATSTSTATVTATATPTDEVTSTATATATGTATSTATTTTTATATATATAAATSSPTRTATPTKTVTPTITPTLAPTSAKVTGTGGAGVNCRAQPSTSATVIAVLREGETVAYRGAASNGWQPVTCAGKAGFISTTYLTGIPVTPTATPRPTGTATPTRTVTATPSVAITGTISPTATGTVTATRTVTVTATASPTGTPVVGGRVQGTGGVGVNCRRTPSTSGTIITTVPEGTVLPYRGAASNGWQPVTCGGQAGYISTAYLTGVTITPTPVKTPGTSPTPTATPPSGSSGVVTGTDGGGVNCRTQPSTSAPVIAIIPEGSIIQFRGSASNGWQPVTCAGQAGFISAAYLTGISAATGELWVDVNLSTQYMIVYRGSTRVLGTYVSTGRPGFDTPTGTYRVNTKLPSQTMSGVLGGEYYNVPNVPWVMYFTDRGHAIHGTYWHSNFGYTMSHGCINLPLDVAAWLYAQAPIGMRVVIHY